MSIEALKEKEKGIMTISPQQEDVVNKPEAKVRFRVCGVQEVFLQRSHEEINIGERHPEELGAQVGLGCYWMGGIC